VHGRDAVTIRIEVSNIFTNAGEDIMVAFRATGVGGEVAREFINKNDFMGGSRRGWGVEELDVKGDNTAHNSGRRGGRRGARDRGAVKLTRLALGTGAPKEAVKLNISGCDSRAREGTGKASGR
jgi:hypothetical protein